MTDASGLDPEQGDNQPKDSKDQKRTLDVHVWNWHEKAFLVLVPGHEITENISEFKVDPHHIEQTFSQRTKQSETLHCEKCATRSLRGLTRPKRFSENLIKIHKSQNK